MFLFGLNLFNMFSKLFEIIRTWPLKESISFSHYFYSWKCLIEFFFYFFVLMISKLRLNNNIFFTKLFGCFSKVLFNFFTKKLIFLRSCQRIILIKDNFFKPHPSHLFKINLRNTRCHNSRIK